MKAHEILNRAAGHLADRAKTYDKPEGERSIAATVAAFNAVTGHELTETQGWLFMALLKAVRSQQNAFKLDSYEDGAAYFALAGESAAKVAGLSKASGKASDSFAVDANAPDWKDAPHWARWVAQDEDGEWWWHEEKPEFASCIWYENDCENVVFALKGNENHNWRNTLEQRPSNDGWIEWNGGECPVDVSTVVQVMFKGKDGIEKICGPAGHASWSHCGYGDIIAYRIIKEQS